MIITLSEVRNYGPCFDPGIYRIHRAKLSTILKNDRIPERHRVWLACHALAAREPVILKRFLYNIYRRAVVNAPFAYDQLSYIKTVIQNNWRPSDLAHRADEAAYLATHVNPVQGEYATQIKVLISMLEPV